MNPKSLEDFENNAWKMLSRGAIDKKHAFNLIQIGTVDLYNNPEIRTVVLRSVDTDSRIISFHTDIRSQKMEGMDKPVAIHLYDSRHRLQLRLNGMPVVHHKDEKARSIYKNLHDGAVDLYRDVLRPGAVIQSPYDNISKVDRQSGIDHFCWINININRMDVLHLGTTHLRALFIYGKDPIRQWVKA